MSKKVVNLGTASLLGKDGDSNRVANTKLQSNDNELYDALGADSEGNLPTALPIVKGGTGTTTLAELKQNLGIDKVNNTADKDKPVSTATQTALNKKANTDEINLTVTELSQSISLALSGKEPSLNQGTDQEYYRGDKTWQILNKNAVGLDQVDNTADIDKPISEATQQALALKADQVATQQALDLKADQVATQQALDAKYDKADLQSSFDAKVDKTDVIAMANGGTGATTAIEARKNIGTVEYVNKLPNTLEPSKLYAIYTSHGFELYLSDPFGFSTFKIGTSPQALTKQTLDDIRNVYFSNGEIGAIYDFNDLSTLCQDAGGLTQVTGAGEPVGLVLDKSQNLELGSELLTNGTFNENMSGWGVLSPATATWNSNGTVTIDRNHSAYYGDQLGQLVQLEADKVYKLEWDVVSLSGSGNVEFAFLKQDRFTAKSSSYYRDMKLGKHTGYFYSDTTEPTWIVMGISGSLEGSTTVGNLSLREIKGNHAYQPNSASRPILRTEPILHNAPIYSDNFSLNRNVYSAGTGFAATSSVVSEQLVLDATSSNGRVGTEIECEVGKKYLVSADVRKDAAATGNTIVSISQSGGLLSELGSFTTPSTSMTRVTFEFTATHKYHYLTLGASTGGTGKRYFDNIKITEVLGYANNLEFDGVDDKLYTPKLFNLESDKVTIFASSNQLSTTAGAFVELGIANINDGEAGSFLMTYGNAYSGIGYHSVAFGSGASEIDVARAYTFGVPDLATVTVTHDIEGDLTTIRRNGINHASATHDKGSGNFMSGTLYIGSRSSGLSQLRANLYSLILVNRLASSTEIQYTEQVLANLSGSKLGV